MAVQIAAQVPKCTGSARIFAFIIINPILQGGTFSLCSMIEFKGRACSRCACTAHAFAADTTRRGSFDLKEFDVFQ